MKRYLLGSLLVSGILLSVAQAYNYKIAGLEFTAPQIAGRSNVANPMAGDIVYDQTDGNFYGRDHTNNWLNLSAGVSGNPAGAIIAYGGTVAPTGYLLCDGSAVSRTTYAALFAAIGTAFGPGDGSTTFNLPDFRGRFLRGVDNGQGRDPDAATRAPMVVGGNNGDNVGSIQGQATSKNGLGINDPGHTHTLTNNTLLYRYIVSGGSNSIPLGSAQATVSVGINSATTGVTITTGDAETRPINAYVNYIIKY